MKRYAIMSGMKIENIIETSEENFSLEGFNLVDITDRPELERGDVLAPQNAEQPHLYDMYAFAIHKLIEETGIPVEEQPAE